MSERACGGKENYLDGVIDVDEGVGVAENAAVACGNEGHVSGTSVLVDDLAQLVFGLSGGDSLDGEAALGIVQETEVLGGLLEGDDVWGEC